MESNCCIDFSDIINQYIVHMHNMIQINTLEVLGLISVNLSFTS